MSKKVVNAIAIVLALCMLLPGTAYADQKASKYFSSYGGDCRWNGSSVEVHFNVNTKKYVDQLGATQIELYESSNLSSWTLVNTFYYSSYPNMMAYNTYSMGSYVTYSNAVSGYHYKARITFIAVKGSDSETRYFYTAYI